MFVNRGVTNLLLLIYIMWLKKRARHDKIIKRTGESILYVKSLKLVNFRNYSSLRAELSPHLNVIVGENAQGKTNVLEAIFLCTFARSHRTSKDEQLIKYNTEGAYVGAEVVSAAGAALIEIKQRRGEKKRIDRKSVV